MRYSRHALREADIEGLWEEDLPSKLPADFEVIETEVTDGRLKWVVRFPCQSDAMVGEDLVLVVIQSGLVKTVWVNSNTDTHCTLDTTKYVRKSQ